MKSQHLPPSSAPITPPGKQALMAPYRARIDALDRQIIELLRQRYAVINEVGHLKAREGLAPVLQDRVDEVRENAARLAAEAGLDAHFIRDLYAQLIAHSCATEENIMRALLTDTHTNTRAAAE